MYFLVIFCSEFYLIILGTAQINYIVDDNNPGVNFQEFVYLHNNDSMQTKTLTSLVSKRLSASIFGFHETRKLCQNSIFPVNVVFDHSLNEFLESDLFTQCFLSNINTRSSCRIFIPVANCVHGKKTMFSSTQLLKYLNWQSDLYIIQQCQDSVNHINLLTVWEIFAIKGKPFANKILEKRHGLSQVGGQAVEVDLTEILVELSKPKEVRRQNLLGTTITTTGFINKENEDENQFEYEIRKDSGGSDTLGSGLSVNILRDFKFALNFTESFSKVYFDESSFANLFTSKNYSFDIMIYHIGITRSGIGIAKPLHATYFDSIHAIFVQPTDNSVRNIYKKPFTVDMWIALIVTWAVICSSCKLTIYLYQKYKIGTTRNDSDSIDNNGSTLSFWSRWAAFQRSEISAFNSCLWCICTLCQQGWPDGIPKSGCFRVILATGLFVSYVCYAAYTGKIVSNLYDVHNIIQSRNQLLSYADTVYVPSTGDDADDILEGFRITTPTTLTKIKVENMDRIYKRLQQRPGRTCAIVWPDTFYAYVKENKGRRSGLDAHFCNTFSSFGFDSMAYLFVPKDSELESLFNYRIIVALERGLIKRYWKAYLKNTKLSCMQTNPVMTTLDFHHVFFAFLILWAGMVSCLLILAVEHIVFQFS